jgi:hypothetical protein
MTMEPFGRRGWIRDLLKIVNLSFSFRKFLLQEATLETVKE